MDLRKSVGKQKEFVLNFVKHVIAKTAPKTSNFVFSPALINFILSFLAAKSPVNHHILSSLLKASSTAELNAVSSKIVNDVLADSTASGGPTISVANGVWIDKSFPIEPYLKHLIEHTYKMNGTLLLPTYNATFNQVDFRTKADEVVEEVNEWVKNQTRGLITDLLSPNSVSLLTDLIFANALFFHGRWQEEFDPSLTKDLDFHRLDVTKVRVPFMSSSYASYRHVLEVYQGFKVLHLLLYRGGNNYLKDSRDFSMHICLPDDKDGLHAMLERLASCGGFLNGYGDIRGQIVNIGEVMIPRFKFGFDFDVSKALEGLGLETPLERIVHKACIEVDEVGTKAAAARPVKACCGFIGPQKKYDFVVDHPFLFLVTEDRSGLVLFLGQVLDPSMH